LLAGDLPTLIKHGLHALRDTLQQDKELTIHNTSIGIVGVASSPSSATDAPASSSAEAPAALGSQAPVSKLKGGVFEKYRTIEGEDLEPYLKSMDAKDSGEEAVATEPTTGVAGEAPAAATTTTSEGEQPQPSIGGDSMQTD
jgi:20S proteasome subunit alpha 6